MDNVNKKEEITLEDLAVMITTGLEDVKTKLREEIKNEKTELGKDITSIKSQMVTKEYLDTKLADLRGNLVTIIRDEDKKLMRQTEMLVDKKILSKDEQRELLAMSPFPQVI